MKTILDRQGFSKFISLAEKKTFLWILVLLMNIRIFPLYAQTRSYEESEDQSVAESTTETEDNNRLSYIGVGGAIGLINNGETALGDGGFSVLGRVTFTNNFSVHTSAILNENYLVSAAITYSKLIKYFYPFVGIGISADTDDFEIDPEITIGVDLAINSFLTGIAKLNGNFNNEAGLFFGIGVNL